FGSDSINARHQDRVQVLLVDGKKTPETADFAEHATGESFVRQILNALFGLVGAGDVNPGIGVGDRTVLGVGGLSHFSVQYCRLESFRALVSHGGIVSRAS